MTYRVHRTLVQAALLALLLGSVATVLATIPSPAVADAGGKGKGGRNSGGHGNAGGNSGNGGNPGNSGLSASGDEDGQIKASDLGKLNGFFNASQTGLEHASPNSAPGSISQTFRDLLGQFTEQASAPDPAVDPVDPATIDDLAEVLAGGSNKPMSPDIVDSILDRLSDLFGDDYSSLDDEAEPEPDPVPDVDPEPGFAEDLSRRVNEINGFEQPQP